MSTSEQANQEEPKKLFWEDLEAMQLEDIFHEDDVPLLSITRNKINVLVMIGVGLVFIMFCSGFFIVIPREINIFFEVKGGVSEEIIQFSEPVQIKKRYFSMGQSVKKDDKILSILSESIGQKIADYHNAKDNMVNFYQFTQPRFNHEQSARTEEINLLTENIAEVQLQIKQLSSNQTKSISDLTSLLEIAEHQYLRDLNLYQSNTIALAGLEQSKQKFLFSKSSLNAAASEYSFQLATIYSHLRDLEIKKENLQNQLITSKAIFYEEQGKMEQLLDNINRSIKTIYGPAVVEESVLCILAKEEGVITLLNDSETTLDPSTVIAKLKIEAVDYYASATADPQQAGSLNIGQKVTLKFSSFPYYYYGTIKGKVETISQSADPEGKFPLTISIEKEHSLLFTKISKGMIGEAAVEVEEYSVIHYLFRKLLKALKW